MPFKKGHRLGEKSGREHSVKTCSWEDARYVQTAKGKILPKSDFKGGGVVGFAKTKQELEYKVSKAPGSRQTTPVPFSYGYQEKFNKYG